MHEKQFLDNFLNHQMKSWAENRKCRSWVTDVLATALWLGKLRCETELNFTPELCI